MNDVILDILCPGSILPVLPDGVEDDGRADVEDEEGEGTTQCNYAPWSVYHGLVKCQNNTAHAEAE